MNGQVQSTEPLALSLTNAGDDRTPVRPDRTLVMKAYYVNDTAFEASLYRTLGNRMTHDALLAVRLNTSTLLHSRLHWRPQTLTDIQESAVRSLLEAAINTKSAMKAVSAAVKTELTERYARSTESLAEDLRPAMALLDDEIQALGDAFG